ncbi:GNAT family N-acetyltransferase [bacterium]|nr:GNAT family N-acetyltransferase [bacterium]
MSTLDHENLKLPSGQSLVLRQCQPSDADAWLELQALVAAESTHTLQMVGRTSDRAKVAESFADAVQDNRSIRLGAFLEGRMIAFLGFFTGSEPLHPWTKHVASFGCFVAKEFWGKGVCRRMLEIMESHARSVGISRIEARVRAQNSRGVKLYTRMGYEIEGTCRSAAVINGVAQDEHLIAKILDASADWTPPVMHSERTVIRPLRLSDAPHIFQYACNPNVCRTVTWDPHTSIEDSKAFILDYAFPAYRKRVPEPWGIALREQPDVVIGTVGCFWVSRAHKSMELAYAIAEPFWGQGLVAECSRLVLSFCFQEYELNRIQSRCMTTNRASARVMEKIGMSFEGTMRSVMLRRGAYIDLHHYSILRSEWERIGD